ncbi:unnamed protein product, partial [Hymenolepis diminuta]
EVAEKKAISWTNFFNNHYIISNIKSEYCWEDKEWKFSFKTKSEYSVPLQASESKTPNQEKRRGQVLRKWVGSHDIKAEICSHELLDSCSSMT